MFWRFGGYANISTIDTLLDKPNVTLEDLLDESDLIQELKAHNTKLIEFLRDEDTLKKLLDYVIAPGPPFEEDAGEEHDDLATPDAKGKGLTILSPTPTTERPSDEEQEKAEKQRLKYSYVACEVLSSETWSILEALMAHVPHLTEFWDFLRRPPQLDPLQAGYFTKVNETLLDKKTEEMLEFFKSLPGIIPAMLQHVDCPMVMDLLLKIISLEKSDGGHGIVDWLQAQDLIPSLLSSLSPDCNSATQTSAGDFLKAIITISANAAQNEQSCIGPNSLTRQLVSEPCMASLISSMLQGGNPLTVGVGIVIEVIRKNNSDYDPENGHNSDAKPTSHDPIYLGTLLRMFAKHVPDFMELILSSTHTVTEGEVTKVVPRGKLSSAWGTQIEPLGFDRFKTCELMAELLHCSNMGLLNEKESEDFIRRRDEERERLRLQGDLTPSKEEGDSGVDISAGSSKFANGINSSVGGTPQDLRLINSSEEDGFEKVAASDVSDALDSEDSSTSAFPKLSDSDEFTDEPLDSPKGTVEGGSNEPDTTLTLTPSKSELPPFDTAGIEDKVRRLSVEDTTMSSPPVSDADTSDNSLDVPSIDTQHKMGDLSPISPHSADKPAPLFSKSADPNKTPTAMSPNPPTSPKTLMNEDAAAIDQIGDISVNMGDDTEIATNTDTDTEDETVVGDYLKMMFVKNKVVPTILSFFFRFPWNNFLHNVVYDVIQQVFNGPMERGYNRNVAIDLFETGNVTDQIVDGQKRSDDAQQKKNMRLGYMGHLTLVAEEVVKFSERHPAELLSQTVMEKVLDRQWIDYVEQTLSQTRERDNAVLGGIRPDIGVGPRQAVLNAVNASQGFGASAALANAGLNGGTGTQQPLDSIDLSNNGSASSATFSQGSNSSFSGFGSSSDDEDEDMDEPEEEDRSRIVTQLSTADTGLTPSNTDQPVPLIPPPPPPLNIAPSRARRRLADRLALHKQQAAQEEAPDSADSGSGIDPDDPFASLGDNDEHDGSDPFSLDEDEQDITASGNRNRTRDKFASSSSNENSTPGFSVSRGLTNLFSTRRQENFGPDDFDREMEEDSSSSGSGDDDLGEDGEGHRNRRPVAQEARRSSERQPLDVGDDDDEDEMGEMVAPTEEGEEDEDEARANSSDEEAMVSPMLNERRRSSAGVPDPEASKSQPPPGFHDSSEGGSAEFQDEEEDDDEGEEGDELVEIAMPVALGDGKRNSMGRG